MVGTRFKRWKKFLRVPLLHRQFIQGKVVKRALDNDSVSLVLVHNHPSGNYHPSRDDITITKKLKAADETIDVSVHDHLIIAGDKFYSFADHGIL